MPPKASAFVNGTDGFYGVILAADIDLRPHRVVLVGPTYESVRDAPCWVSRENIDDDVWSRAFAGKRQIYRCSDGSQTPFPANLYRFRRA